MSDGDHTPPELEPLTSLVNTHEFDEPDALTGPTALATWAGEHHLAAPDAAFTDADVARVKDFREALRGLLLANNGHELDPEIVDALHGARHEAQLVVAFDDGGKARLEPACSGVDTVLARLRTLILEAQVGGSWRRLKACPWHSCGYAFYDHSRNQSRTWCDMATCGNRAKARSYRERARHPH